MGRWFHRVIWRGRKIIQGWWRWWYCNNLCSSFSPLHINQWEHLVVTEGVAASLGTFQTAENINRRKTGRVCVACQIWCALLTAPSICCSRKCGHTSEKLLKSSRECDRYYTAGERHGCYLVTRDGETDLCINAATAAESMTFTPSLGGCHFQRLFVIKNCEICIKPVLLNYFTPKKLLTSDKVLTLAFLFYVVSDTFTEDDHQTEEGLPLPELDSSGGWIRLCLDNRSLLTTVWSKWSE